MLYFSRLYNCSDNFNTFYHSWIYCDSRTAIKCINVLFIDFTIHILTLLTHSIIHHLCYTFY